MSICPECGATAQTPEEEMAHMSDQHPEVIAERMRAAGFVWDERRAEWVDTLDTGT